MRKPEQRLWDRMRAALRGKVRLERIENLAGVGIPDVLVLAQGNVTLVELKVVERFPARPDTRVLGGKGLSQDQKNWHVDWHGWGGKSFIVVGVGTANLYAVPGRLADDVNSYTKKQLDFFAVTWDTLITELRTGG